ncbi:phosphate acetyltransferase [Eubacterium sp. 14-2]|uniref:phosphate acetyltransferase n=1 Tax=Eubacterium sp. 14-2 TaxID=1235790 RepID=UPI0003411B10|nr:phosphate acetyltransferase [Eubacterium sp. 14-2]
MGKNMQGFGTMIGKLKKSPKRIVFTEGSDPRILEAASRLLASYFLTPLLVGNKQEVEDAAEEFGYNIRGAEIIDPETFESMNEMAETLCELRKSKNLQMEEALKILKQGNYFGTMLVKMGYADCLLGGATYTTADTVRPALQLIKTRPGHNIVSSCFILVRPSATGENEVLAMADCSINIRPTEDELVDIAIGAADCGQLFGIDPKIAFLSYSTLGSGKGEDVDKMRNAALKTKARRPELPISGEIQFDAAVSPRVARTKCPNDEIAGHANVFIFPDINAGNIGYKIAQRMGNFEAYGPILLGLKSPINDLSRGCTADEVYSMAIITAALVDEVAPR